MRNPLVFVVLAASLTGCGRSDPAKPTPGKPAPSAERIKVGFVSNNPEQFWTIAEAGTKKAADELDVEVLFRRPATGAASEQKEIIDALLTQGVKAIAVSVIEPVQQKNYLNRIAERVPLITQDNDAPDTKRLCYIGTDNYEAGKEVGRLVKKAMPNGGTIAIFVGMIEPLNAQQRRQGVLDELAGKKNATGSEYGKYHLHGSGPANGPFTDNVDHTVAMDNAKNVLVQFDEKKEPNLCLVGLWAYNPPMIYRAVKASGRQGKVKIVGFDEDEGTLLGIKEGHIDATVIQQPFLFGYEAVKLMTALAKGDQSGLPKDGIKHVPHRVINKENVDAFHAELKKLLGK